MVANSNVDKVIHIPKSWWEKPHKQKLRYFIPEWDDLVDPDYDFLNDTHSGGRSNWANEVYAHQMYPEPNYDGLLMSPEGVSNSELVSIIARICADEYGKSFFEKVRMRIIDFEGMFFEASAHRMRTYLSKAPNPLIPYVQSVLEPKKWKKGGLQSTLITDIFGGKTGKSEYDFLARKMMGGIKIVTAQDGHEADKTKELSGRIRCQHIAGDLMDGVLSCSPRAFEAHLVLDGDWSQSQMESLHNAGYSSINSVADIAKLAQL